jgi:hypothetical protein
MFLHITGVALFLFGHGISGGTSIALRWKIGAEASRTLLQLSVWSYRISYPGLLLLLVTGVWMGFDGSWWGRGWIWASIVVLVITAVVMGFFSRNYHMARAAKTDTEVSTNLASVRPEAIALIGAAGVFVLLFLMVFKPF